jgi:hypothetical protein
MPAPLGDSSPREAAAAAEGAEAAAEAAEAEGAEAVAGAAVACHGFLPHLLAHWTSQIIAGPHDSCAVLAGDDPDRRA